MSQGCCTEHQVESTSVCVFAAIQQRLLQSLCCAGLADVAWHLSADTLLCRLGTCCIAIVCRHVAVQALQHACRQMPCYSHAVASLCFHNMLPSTPSTTTPTDNMFCCIVQGLCVAMPSLSNYNNLLPSYVFETCFCSMMLLRIELHQPLIHMHKQ